MSTTPPILPPTPRQDDPRVERTRAAVIEAAAELLTADGPIALTHANVAAAAKVSRTTVYAHWPTIGELLRDTIEVLGEAPITSDQLSGVLRDDLDLLCGQLASDLRDEQRASMILSMMERARYDADVASVRDEFLRVFTDVFATVIRTAVQRGELRADIDVERSIAHLIGSFIFARFMTSEPFDDAFADAVLDDFVRVNAPR